MTSNDARVGLPAKRQMNAHALKAKVEGSSKISDLRSVYGWSLAILKMTHVHLIVKTFRIFKTLTQSSYL